MTWEPPVCTRWWIEGDRVSLFLVTEHTVDRPLPAMTPPNRDDHAWLSQHGIGVSLEHHGAHGWIEEITRMRERPDETRARKARDKARGRDAQGTLL